MKGYAQTNKLRTLYTDHVLTDEMLTLWNVGIQRLCHVVPAGGCPIAERPRLVREFVHCIVKHLLHVDSSPTLSRFFTCRDCQDRMLTMHMMGLVPHALRLRKIQPRKENLKRLTSVQNCFGHSEASQTLRRISLTFQLTGGVEALLSEEPAEGKPPPAVRLCNKAAVNIVHDRLRRIMGSIAAGDDPELDIGGATGTLVATSMELILRLRRYTEYPFAL